MICKNCGNPLAEDAKFCTSCGQSLEVEDTIEASVQEPIVEETIAPETAVAENETSEVFASTQEGVDLENDDEAFVVPDFEGNKKPKKSKKKLIFAIIACVLVVAIALSVVFNLDYLKGFWVKNFGSDLDYYTYVEKKALSDAKDSLVEYYGNYTETVSTGKTASKGSVKLKLGDELKTLAPMLGINQDAIDGFGDVGVDFFVNQNGDLANVKMGIVLSDTTILSAEVIANLVAEEMYIRIPEFSKDYLKNSVSYNSAYDEETTSAMNTALTDAEFIAALPSDDALDRVLEKCIDAVLGSIEDVKAGTETVTGNGISEELTVFECEISDKTGTVMLVNVLKAIKDDADVKAAINNIKDYGVENGLCEKDDDIYGNFQEKIGEAIKEFEGALKNMSDRAFLTLTTYVNSSHEIVGRKVAFDSEEVFTYYDIHDGSDFTTKIEVADTFAIVGSGTESGDAISGNYSISVEGQTYVTVTLTDFEVSGTEVSGKIKIAPDQSLYKQLDAQVSAMLTLYDPAIELIIDGDEDSAKVEYNLIVKNSTLIGLEYSFEPVEATEIKIPANSIDATDADALQEWAKGIDVDAIKNNLKKAGVPVEYLEQILNNITEQNAQVEEFYDYEYSY